MSFSPALHAFRALDFPVPRSFPRRGFSRKGRPSGSQPAARADNPVLFMAGSLLAIGLAVIPLWQGLGLLLPH